MYSVSYHNKSYDMLDFLHSNAFVNVFLDRPCPVSYSKWPRNFDVHIFIQHWWNVFSRNFLISNDKLFSWETDYDVPWARFRSISRLKHGEGLNRQFCQCFYQITARLSLVSVFIRLGGFSNHWWHGITVCTRILTFKGCITVSRYFFICIWLRHITFSEALLFSKELVSQFLFRFNISHQFYRASLK